MKQIVIQIIDRALAELPELRDAAADIALESTVERTRDPSHGDFACNIAMRLAKPARKSPPLIHVKSAPTSRFSLDSGLK